MTKRDQASRSPVHYAAMANDVTMIEQLAAEGSNLHLGDKQGFTPLHLAAQEFCLQAAEALIRYGSPVDSINIFGNTPLFVAVFNSHGRGEMIALLRRYGANPQKVNKYGQTPLGLARLISNYDVAQFFNDID